MGTEQKVAVITGASQGIGAALVKAYRDRNYRVVATARSIKPSNDDGVLSVAGDIADAETAERVIGEAMARFGRIDTLVNNAGIFIAKPFTQYSEADFAGALGNCGFGEVAAGTCAETQPGNWHELRRDAVSVVRSFPGGRRDYQSGLAIWGVRRRISEPKGSTIPAIS